MLRAVAITGAGVFVVVTGIEIPHEDLAAFGALLTGVSGVVTSFVALKLAHETAKRHSEAEIEKRVTALFEQRLRLVGGALDEGTEDSLTGIPPPRESTEED